MSADTLHVRMAHLEGAYEQISDRLNGIDGRLAQIDSRFHQIDSRFHQIDRKIDTLDAKMDRRFMWIIGLLVVSIILPFIARLTTI